MTAVHIIVAMKPTEGNFAQNALEHGVAGLNIDGGRIDHDGMIEKHNTPSKSGLGKHGIYGDSTREQGANSDTRYHATGRWPANVIHDGSDEVTEKFPETAFSSGGGMKRSGSGNNIYGKQQGHPQVESVGFMDSGSAARFFKECSNEG